MIQELISVVEDALGDCQTAIDKRPTSVLSEADFERMLCGCISYRLRKQINNKTIGKDFAVHTQISHYLQKNGKTKLKDRVDILILDEAKIERCKSHKEGHYNGESIALELKYIRLVDSVRRTKVDLEKWERLKIESSLYVVALIDYNSKRFLNRREKRFAELCNKVCPEMQYGDHKLFCRSLHKKIKE